MRNKIAACANRIEDNLIAKIQDVLSVDSIFRYWKRKMLRYNLKKPDWIRYVDRDLSWITAQYALGLLATGHRHSIRTLTRYYDRILLIQKVGFPIFEVPDHVYHAEILLDLYCIYGEKRYASLIHEAANMLKQIAKENSGLIVYWPPDKTVLVDTLGMTIRFCYLYAQQFGDSEMADIAERQIAFTEEFCVDSKVGLPIHSLNYENWTKEGSYTWGRGAGWYLIGLTETVINTGKRKDRLWQVLERIMAYQDDGGFLPDDLDCPTHVDSSITSMAAYSMVQLLTTGQFDEEKKKKIALWLRRCTEALLSVTDASGGVQACSGECQGAGQYSQEYGNYFAQGYTLAVLSVIQKDLELQKLIIQ